MDGCWNVDGSEKWLDTKFGSNKGEPLDDRIKYLNHLIAIENENCESFNKLITPTSGLLLSRSFNCFCIVKYDP